MNFFRKWKIAYKISGDQFKLLLQQYLETTAGLLQVTSNSNTG